MPKGYIHHCKIGKLFISSSENKINKISKAYDYVTYEEYVDDIILHACKEIDLYLEGKLKNFTFEVINNHFSTFKRSVFKALKVIPYASTIPYKELAMQAGSENAYRAVGTLLKNNDLLLYYPCHRVINKNNTIGEYVLGPDIKKYLLDIEKQQKGDVNE